MAYEPTVWQENDLITAEKLNKLEQGVQNEQVGPAGPTGPAGADGAPGAPGAPGAAAGFGTPTATIDNTSGTPRVEVEATGDNTEKVFNFKFFGLKGETGPAGANGQNAEPVSAATKETLGTVKQMELISDLSSTPTQEDFNGLLAKLKAAGIMAAE